MNRSAPNIASIVIKRRHVMKMTMLVPKSVLKNFLTDFIEGILYEIEDIKKPHRRRGSYPLRKFFWI